MFKTGARTCIRVVICCCHDAHVEASDLSKHSKSLGRNEVSESEYRQQTKGGFWRRYNVQNEEAKNRRSWRLGRLPASSAGQPRLADGAPGCAQPVQIVAGLDEQVADHPGNDRAVHLRYDGEPVKVRGQRDRERELSCIVVRLVRGQ